MAYAFLYEELATIFGGDGALIIFIVAWLSIGSCRVFRRPLIPLQNDPFSALEVFILHHLNSSTTTLKTGTMLV